MNHFFCCIYKFCQQKLYNIKIIVVGNKSDLEEDRIVNYEEGKQFADEHGLVFIETSAKTGSNVNKVFSEICKEIFGPIIQQPTDEKANLRDIKQKPKKASTSRSLSSLYHANGGNNVFARLTLASCEYADGINLLKKRAMSHIIKGNQSNFASYKTLQDMLTSEAMNNYEDSINQQVQKLLQAPTADEDKLKEPTSAVYQRMGGANIFAQFSFFCNGNSPEKSIQTLKKRALDAIERGDLQSASLKTLRQVNLPALQELFAGLNPNAQVSHSLSH